MEPITTRWTDPRTKATWLIEFTDSIDGLTSLTITSEDGKTPISLTTLTRKMGLGSVLDQARRDNLLRPIPDGTETTDKVGNVWTFHGDLALGEETPRKRRTKNQAHYDEVARHYNAALDANLRNPVEHVADKMFVQHSTAVGWIYEARQEPWKVLPLTSQGVAKGGAS